MAKTYDTEMIRDSIEHLKWELMRLSSVNRTTTNNCLSS